MVDSSELELDLERDRILESIISLEDQFNRECAISKAEYLRHRHELEQHPIQVMHELTRRTAFEG
nr:hypothetical protein [Candidatus Sigynarchaeum springense]